MEIIRTKLILAIEGDCASINLLIHTTNRNLVFIRYFWVDGLHHDYFGEPARRHPGIPPWWEIPVDGINRIDISNFSYEKIMDQVSVNLVRLRLLGENKASYKSKFWS